MITLKKSNNIFYNRKLILNYFLSNESNSVDELEEIDWFEVKITGDDNDKIFSDFIEKLITELKEEFYIDLITYERSDQLKGKIRSYTKCYYDLRKQHLISEENIAEKEIDTNENRSIYSGILQVDEVDNEIIFEELLNNYSRIIHAEIRTDKEEKGRLERLINKIDSKLLRTENLTELNYLVLLERFLKANSILISYMYNGRDELIFTAYSGKKVSNKLESLINKSIPSDQVERKIIATSDEVDKLIESYFNDWRRVKINT